MHSFIRDFESINANTDKLFHHGYQRIYPWFFSHFRDQEINLLEIGLQDNDSLVLWKQYFRKANIFGIDINPKENVAGARIFKCDQSSSADLKEFKKAVSEQFDIIVDDGSHVPTHQILTLNELWEKLKPGGVYVIEDIETSFWGKSELYGYNFNANNTKENVFNVFKSKAEIVNSEFLQKDMLNKLNKDNGTVNSVILNDVEMITFAYNSIILVKKDPYFEKYYNRKYRFSGYNNRGFIQKLKGRLSKILK